MSNGLPSWDITMIKKIFIFPIRIYQKFISPMLGAKCRYYPTCSEYTAQAIETHGVIKGIVLGAYRIIRCNPWSKGGYDPVPPKGKWTNKR